MARTASGSTIYEDEQPVFFQDGNAAYYLDSTNLLSCAPKRKWVLRHLPPGGSLLDVGSSFGHFLKAMAGAMRCQGVEVNHRAVAWSRKHFQVNSAVGSAYAVPENLRGPHDAVTMWDVLEHLEDPVRALQEAHAVLNPGGFLFLSTPDAGSLVARVMGRRWHYLDPVQHIHLFNRHNMAMALAAAGFSPVAYRHFGHYYRTQYVFDRLRYLSRSRTARMLLGGMRWLLRPAMGLPVYVMAGDVIGLAARRTERPAGAQARAGAGAATVNAGPPGRAQ